MNNVIQFDERANQDFQPQIIMTEELIQEIEFLFYAVETGQIPGKEAAEICLNRFRKS